MAILEDICTLLQQGRAPKVKELVGQAIEKGFPEADIRRRAFVRYEHCRGKV